MVKRMLIGIGEAEETMGNQEYVENQVVAVAESKREAKKLPNRSAEN